MSAIAAWVGEMLAPDEERSDVKVTVRVDPATYMSLTFVAEQLGVSKTAAATGMLEAAISEAYGMLCHPDPREQEEIERGMVGAQ